MLKKLLILSGVVGLMFSSCADPDLGPVVTFDDMEVGIQAALIEGGMEEIDLANPSTASVTNTVMLRGAEAANYTIYVSFEDRNPDNGDDSKPEVLLEDFDASTFTSVSESPYPRVTYTIALTDLVRDFGLNIDDLKAGDRFRVRTTATRTDGAVFGNNNSSAAVRGSAFAGYFDFNLLVTCPLPDAAFTGTYALTYEGDADGGFGRPYDEVDVSVSVVAGSSTKRTFDVKSLPDAGNFGDASVVFNIVCDVAVFEDTTSPVGCGGSIIVGGAAGLPIISLTDDSVIKLAVNDYKDDGGCGVAPIAKTIVLTKK